MLELDLQGAQDELEAVRELTEDIGATGAERFFDDLAADLATGLSSKPGTTFTWSSGSSPWLSRPAAVPAEIRFIDGALSVAAGAALSVSFEWTLRTGQPRLRDSLQTFLVVQGQVTIGDDVGELMVLTPSPPGHGSSPPPLLPATPAGVILHIARCCFPGSLQTRRSALGASLTRFDELVRTRHRRLLAWQQDRVKNSSDPVATLMEHLTGDVLIRDPSPGSRPPQHRRGRGQSSP